MPAYVAVAAWWLAQTAPVENPVTWLTGIIASSPIAGVLLYIYIEVRKDRDRYRDIVFDTLAGHRDAIRAAAVAQEKLAEIVEARTLDPAELVKLRRAVDRLDRRREGT